MSEYSQGICHDGAAILKDGAMMTIDDVVSELNRIKELEHREWLLKMELEGYQELCKVQEFIIDELKVAQSQE